MNLNIQKEQFSIAYVRAVAAVAGVKVCRVEVDDDSIDIGIERAGGCAPKLDLQLKCTADPLPPNGDIAFQLKLKNYNELRRPTVAPRWLVVLFVPQDCADWLTIAPRPNEILLRRCAWWTSLAGRLQVDNAASVTVHFPRANVLTPSSLNSQLDEIEKRFRPA